MSESSEHNCLGAEHDDLSRYFAKAAATQTPLSASFELTRRCNFRCVHCYLGDQEAIHKYRHRELDTDRILGLLDEMVEAGTFFLTLTGGDPMLRPDFVRIYEHAVRIGLLVSVYCNGSLITDEIVRSFIRYPPRIVEVTLYGATAKTFEAITQKPSSFSACMEGVERLRKAKVRLRLKTMAITLNSEEVPAMREMAEDMGVEFRHDCSIIPALPNKDNHGRTNTAGTGEGDLLETLRFRLTPKQAVDIDFGSVVVKEKLRRLVASKEEMKRPRATALYTCDAGRSSYHLTPYGRLQPCLITSHPSVDLISGSTGIISGWEILNRLVAEQQAGPDFLCTECNKKKQCTGCPSSFFLETGDREKSAPFYCNYAEYRGR
ncbi:MAG: radical SAM protein [Candidatus Electrothrix sp. AX5]|nr:radical SAM protein [Candidatus Electrothrix sp. AX5]